MTGALLDIVTAFAVGLTLGVIAIAAMISWEANR